MNPQEFFKQIWDFTRESYDKLKIPYEGKGKNNYGPYKEGEPSGHVMHYTGSPDSPSRLTNIMRRFQLNSKARVGISLVIFDKFHTQLQGVRKNYPQLYGTNGILSVDVLHWGFDLCFWSSNWANPFTVATELRNAGKIKKEGNSFTWGGNPWKGRTPVEVRGMYAEPFTDEQILDSVYICRQIKKVQGANFNPMHFMSHFMVHPNKWDAWPQYPFGRVKRAVCNGGPFTLKGYIEELNDLSCPKVVDEDTAETFLVTMGYLMRPSNPDNMAMKKYLDEDVPLAIRFFQNKKGVKATGKLNETTIKSMEAVRRAYKL